MQLVFNLAYAGVLSLREAMDMPVTVLDEAYKLLEKARQAEAEAYKAASRGRR